ncbi:MAG: FtsX-like permease family protein [Planctomycetes bacterium]|nr:FtsX-like permease family protein [Planctomycetota bacterium]MCB9901637.1 FtsX-like permease family protein [Planctomycetota bacterium]
MYRLFLALRYLRSRLVNMISVGGVMVGVAVLIVVTSVFDGFQEQVRATVRGTLSHLVLTPRRPADAGPDWKQEAFADLERRLLAHDPRIVAVAPQIRLPIAYPYRSNRLEWANVDGLTLHQMEAVGIDWAREAKVSDLKKNLIAGDQENPFFDVWGTDKEKTMVLVGRTWAEHMKFWGPMDFRRVVSGPMGPDGQPMYEPGPPPEPVEVDPNDPMAQFAPKQDPRRYINEIRVYLATFSKDATTGEMRMDQQSTNPLVKGIYDGQDATSEMTQMYFDIEKLRKVTHLEQEYFEVRMRLKDYHDAPEIQASLAKAFPELDVQTWEDLKRDFLQAVETEKVMLVVVLSFIVLLGGFIILATLTLTVVEKTKDIGILGALGAPRAGILRVFLTNGLLIGIIGSLLGLGLGWWFVQNVDGVRAFVAKTTGVDLFPANIYSFRFIPTVWQWGTVLAIMGGSVLISFLAGLLPALRAARLDPVKALRYE